MGEAETEWIDIRPNLGWDNGRPYCWSLSDPDRPRGTVEPVHVIKYYEDGEFAVCELPWKRYEVWNKPHLITAKVVWRSQWAAEELSGA